jgi:hypothetical protein
MLLGSCWGGEEQAAPSGEQKWAHAQFSTVCPEWSLGMGVRACMDGRPLTARPKRLSARTGLPRDLPSHRSHTDLIKRPRNSRERTRHIDPGLRSVTHQHHTHTQQQESPTSHHNGGSEGHSRLHAAVATSVRDRTLPGHCHPRPSVPLRRPECRQLSLQPRALNYR